MRNVEGEFSVTNRNGSVALQQVAGAAADEPTGDLDSESGAELIDLMKQLNEELDTTFIVVTHDPAVSRETERVLIILNGPVADEIYVRTPYEDDLTAVGLPALGQEIVEGDVNMLARFGPDESTDEEGGEQCPSRVAVRLSRLG